MFQSQLSKARKLDIAVEPLFTDMQTLTIHLAAKDRCLYKLDRSKIWTLSSSLQRHYIKVHLYYGIPSLLALAHVFTCYIL